MSEYLDFESRTHAVRNVRNAVREVAIGIHDVRKVRKGRIRSTQTPSHFLTHQFLKHQFLKHQFLKHAKKEP